MIVAEMAEEGKPVPANVAVSEEPLIAVTVWAALSGAAFNLAAREIINALIRDGFVLHNRRGSRQRFRHPHGRRVTVTFHRASGTFPIGTLRSMIEIQALWSEDDLRRPLLIG